ncbi:MAG: CsgG/HfaB family protein [bacterium]|nr:CsgG/HfaB family protein [bacterium]
MKRTGPAKEKVLAVCLAVVLSWLGGCTYTWRPNWWNFYERGLQRSSEGQLQEAAEDFETAAGEKAGATLPRPKDARRVRTYGMHFIEDYFPHRELGIAYYRMKRFAEAEQELLVSLDHTPSAKAKAYLNLVRAEMLREKPAQDAPPSLRLSTPVGPYLNTRTVKLAGVARSKNHVSAILVNGQRLFTELAEQEREFSTDLELKPGKNEVVVEVVDLVQKSTTKTLSLNVDVQYPTVAIEDVVWKDADTVTVRGTAMDNAGLSRLLVEGEEQLVEEAPTEMPFSVDAALEGAVTVEVLDVAGNRTRAAVRITQDMLESPKPGAVRPILLAMLPSQVVADGDGIGVLLAEGAAAGDGTPPLISLRDVTDGRIIYDEEFIFEGFARDNGRLAVLSVNGEDLLGARTGVLVKYFTYRATLRTGENTFTVVGVDRAGNRAEKRFTILRRIQEPLQVAARLTLGLLPLQQNGATLSATNQVYDLLLGSFLASGRFNLVEREEAAFQAILTELKIGNSELADKTTAVRIGRLRTAEGMLYGKTIEDEQSITVDLWLVDTETSEILFFADVYGEDKTRDELKWLADGLVLKFRQRFPLVKGKITEVTVSGVFINNGSAEGIWAGMKYLVLKEGEEPGSLKMREVNGRAMEARARTVQKDSCFAEYADKSAGSEVQVNDPAITK